MTPSEDDQSGATKNEDQSRVQSDALSKFTAGVSWAKYYCIFECDIYKVSVRIGNRIFYNSINCSNISSPARQRPVFSGSSLCINLGLGKHFAGRRPTYSEWWGYYSKTLLRTAVDKCLCLECMCLWSQLSGCRSASVPNWLRCSLPSPWFSFEWFAWRHWNPKESVCPPAPIASNWRLTTLPLFSRKLLQQKKWSCRRKCPRSYRCTCHWMSIRRKSKLRTPLAWFLRLYC